jgi:hypothetical protein
MMLKKKNCKYDGIPGLFQKSIPFISPLSQFQKSAIVVPAKAGHEVKRNTIQYFQFFPDIGFRRCDAFNRFEIDSADKIIEQHGGKSTMVSILKKFRKM